MDAHPMSGPRKSRFTVAGVTVEVESDRAEDVVLASSLAAFESPADSSADINIQIEWSPSLGVHSASRVFDSGSVWHMYEGDAGFVVDFQSSILGESPYKRLRVDRTFHKATLQINQTCFADGLFDACPLEYPLDELLIMHRLTQEKAIELHGSGIVRPNGDANLFVGHSGAGKSTTTRLWTEREDVEVLSDDRIIVRREENAAVERAPFGPCADASTRGVLRLRGNRAYGSAPDDNAKKMRMYGTPWHGEAMYASPNSAPLTRIFVLQHGRGNVITPLTPSQAVAELFARSFVPFHRHEYVESALTFLEEVVDSVPVYRYDFEPDERAVEKIIHFHD